VARYGGAAVTEAHRDAAAAQLREHYAVGRLSLDEFQDHLDAVYRAQTARELGTVTDSLPRDRVAIPPGAPWSSYPGGHPLNVLITAFVVHGGLLGVVVGALLAILAAGVAAVGALVWLARRLWRRHAWIEAVPLVIGQPWLSRVARMARLLLTGHALWRLRVRLASRA